MDEITINIVKQIDEAISAHHGWAFTNQVGGSEKGKILQQMKIYTKMSDAIIRFAPHGSAYMTLAKPIFDSLEKQLQGPYTLPESHLARMAGILESLKNAYTTGYLKTIEELVNSGLFSDFLEMGNYYLNEGHKDAAAVILGGVLEEHLRKLCQKNGIDITYDNGKSETKMKKTSILNQDLVKNAVYNEGQKKQVDAWLFIRNSAAHGKYSEYTKDQVQNMLDGLRIFFNLYAA